MKTTRLKRTAVLNTLSTQILVKQMCKTQKTHHWALLASHRWLNKKKKKKLSSCSQLKYKSPRTLVEKNENEHDLTRQEKLVDKSNIDDTYENKN